QLRAFAKAKVFAPAAPRQLHWPLEEHLGLAPAQAFRRAHLHLSLSTGTGMGPRYKNDTELERLHVAG
ncbi:MAG: hypothetical protein ACOVOD_03865, partial [Rhodoferax sp.]